MAMATTAGGVLHPHVESTASAVTDPGRVRDLAIGALRTTALLLIAALAILVLLPAALAAQVALAA